MADLLGLSQVVVELRDVVRVGVEAAGGANAALDLDEGIERRQVHGAMRPPRGRLLLDDLAVPRQLGEREEVPHGAGNVRLRLGPVVPAQNFGRRLGIARIFVIQVFRHSAYSFPGPQTAARRGQAIVTSIASETW